MPLKGFGLRSEEPENKRASGAALLSRQNQRAVHPVTRIDASSKLTGKLHCKGPVRLEGKIKGEIRSEQEVTVADGACVEAVIHAESISIAGEIVGDIIATSKITLEKTARVTGDLRTPGIVIEEGAKLEGRIDIGSEHKADKEAAPAKDKDKDKAGRNGSSRTAATPRPAGPSPA